MIVVYTLLGCAAVVAIWLGIVLSRARAKQAQLTERLVSAENNLSASQKQFTEKETVFRNEMETKNLSITELTAQLASSEERILSLKDQIERDKHELEKLQASFRLEFRNLANEMLEEKSTQFKKTNKEAIGEILNPLKDTIIGFKERVEAIYSDGNKQRGSLENQLKMLHELNRKITEETTALTNALKGNSKVQGDWGEMILQTILEGSGLQQGRHYRLQESIRDAEGRLLRPDVTLMLPGGKQLIIDSKVSLTAYVNYTACEDETGRERHLKDHIASIRRHIDELHPKGYQDLVDSPDFVIMFVPNEPAFLCALQQEPALWNQAYKKNVIISSPTNFFTLIKIVDDLWKRDDQSKNAIEIAERGGKLYDKFVNFVESMENIGKGIGVAQSNYEKAYSQLKDGTGNLIGQAEKLRELGVKAKKNLPSNLVANALTGANHEE